MRQSHANWDLVGHMRLFLVPYGTLARAAIARESLQPQRIQRSRSTGTFFNLSNQQEVFVVYIYMVISKAMFSGRRN